MRVWRKVAANSKRKWNEGKGITMKWGWIVVLAACLGGLPRAHAQVDVAAYVKKDAFDDIKISPDGDYFAATVALEDKTGLVVLRRSDLKVTARFALGKNTHIYDFVWVNPTRLVVSMAQKFGALDKPQATGELYGVNADGSQPLMLVGQRVQGGGPGSRIMTAKAEQVAAVVVDTLPGRPQEHPGRSAAIRREPVSPRRENGCGNGRRIPMTRAPVRGRFHHRQCGRGSVRQGSAADNNNQLYYREGEDAEWKLINDEIRRRNREFAFGFSVDDRIAYLRSERREGPDASLHSMLQRGKRTEIQRDPVSIRN